ncbi:MAG: dihydroorotate oxidase electron transfer subunit [Capsulimonas sp.]|nr:dihydroorotate oxidase electron transfer subunit [Capsulimonas sp.]
MPVSAQQYLVPVISNDEIIADHRVLTCYAPEVAALARPGHFLNVSVGDGYDPFLRKPFSIYTVNRERGEISMLFSIVGATTRGMAKKRAGDEIDLVGPLGGKIFQPDTREGATHVMVGGGYGVPPLVFLSKELLSAAASTNIEFIIGARHKDLLLCEAELAEAGVTARMTTEDGSHGMRGRVTDALRVVLAELGASPVTVYCCGPTPMMHAVSDLCLEVDVPCQLSVEVGMPCGMGVCMACVVDLADGRRVRCCTDGPVFAAGEVKW